MKDTNNYFAYMRISTKEERELQSFARQEHSLQTYAKNNNIKYTLVFKDDKSGKNFEDRAEWQRLESLLKPGDTIVFKELSRLTREAENGYKKFKELMDNNINLVFLDNPTISTDYIKNMLSVADGQNIVTKTSIESIVKLLLIVELDRVEQERKIIRNRIIDGIKATDKKSGRTKGNVDKLTEDLRTDIKSFLTDRSIKQSDLMEKHHISRNTLKKYAEIVKEEMKK